MVIALKLEHIKLFLDVVDSGSISQAAKMGYITQQGLSSALKQIESELQICLFNRSNKGVELTDEGEKEFVKLMMETASKPIHFFLDFNAVIVNLDKLPPESQQSCIASIEENIEILKTYLEENLREKENDPEIPKTGMAVLQQQIVLADAIEKWIISLKKDF